MGDGLGRRCGWPRILRRHVECHTYAGNFHPGSQTVVKGSSGGTAHGAVEWDAGEGCFQRDMSDASGF